MNVWEIGVLRGIESRSGSANTQEIYSELEGGRFIKLSDKDLRKTEYGNRPAYQHQVRSHLSNLVDTGDLKRLSRGIYLLTAKGRRRIG